MGENDKWWRFFTEKEIGFVKKGRSYSYEHPFWSVKDKTSRRQWCEKRSGEETERIQLGAPLYPRTVVNVKVRWYNFLLTDVDIGGKQS